jgi:trans-2,3-dihydro-3-hydroxyanthranilate isomerase
VSSSAQLTSFEYVIVDVFTDTPFGGNQLAVFPDASGMSTGAMQKIALEFNFAESTFVLPACRSTQAARIRIFTPKCELPFAGHPTVGTAAVLAHLDLLRFENDGRTVIFEEGIGEICVHIGASTSRSIYTELILTRGVDQPRTRPVPHDVARALSLGVADISDVWFGAVGIPFCFVHLATEAAVDAAVLDLPAWTARVASTWAPQLFLFAGELSSGGMVYARMFAPAFGIDEDPATGSAAAALVGMLAERTAQENGAFDLIIRQGVAMGRPSTMSVRAQKQEGRVTRLHLGGPSVIVARGQMHVADLWSEKL